MSVLEINHGVHKYIGAASDTKPTAATHGCTTGSTFYAQDTGILYITYDGTNWVEKDTIVRLETSPSIDIGDVTLLAGTAVVGKVGLVDSGGSVALDKTEDAAHSSGDKGIMALGVRKDAGTTLAGADGDYAPYQLDQHGGMRVGRPIFGEPTLVSSNNSSACWMQGIVSPLDQKSSTGWLADLFGGIQTGDDWARVNIPVDELLLTKLTTAQWTYYMDANDYMGVSMVIWVHDPANWDNRAEISQDAQDVESAVAWNKHVLATSDHFFFYGEGVSGNTTCTTPGTHYTLAQFQADACFSTWNIYRITLEFGWGAAGNTFGDAYVADVQLNGIAIPLKPDASGSGKVARRFATGAAALATALTPKTPYKLLSLVLHLSAAATQQTFTATIDATRGTAYDTVLVSQALVGVTDLVRTWTDGFWLEPEDELDCAWTNTDTKTYGLTVTYQTV